MNNQTRANLLAFSDPLPLQASPDVESAALRSAMRQMAGGVAIVTTGSGDDRTGATVTSATALSVDPPRMLVSLNRSSSTWPVLEKSGAFAVNLVALRHQNLANRFAGVGGVKGRDRYEGAGWTTLVSGAPVLEDAVAVMDCEVEEAIERHSHVLIIGRVVALRTGLGVSLAYADGRYHEIRE